MAFDPNTAVPIDSPTSTIKRPNAAASAFDPSTARPIATANDADVPSEFRSAPVAPKPSAFRASDIPKAAAGDIVKAGGGLVNAFGEFGRMVARPIVSGVNTAAGREVLSEPQNAFRPVGDAISGYGDRILGGTSDRFRDASAKNLVEGDIADPASIKLGEGASDPLAWVAGGLNLAAQAVPMLAGGLEGRALKLAPEIAEALPGVMAKLGRGEALTAAEKTVAEAGNAAASTAGKRAIATGAGIGGVQGAMSSADAEHERIMSLADQDLSVLPGYQSRISAGMTPVDARKDLADKSAEDTFAATLPVATAAGAVGTAPLIHDAQSALGKIAGEGVLRRAATGAALEAPVQGAAAVAQNAASIAAANEATGETRDLTEGSAPIAATGAALGGAFGAFGAAATRPQPRAKVPFPDARPGSLSDAANVQAESGARPAPAATSESSQPARGTPQSETPAQTPKAPPGTQGVEDLLRSQHTALVKAEEQAAKEAQKPEGKAAPAAEATPEPVAPATVETTGTQASASAAEATPEPARAQPPDVPWIDKSTGEHVQPSDDQLRDQFHKMFDAADTAGSGMRATAATHALADEWGVPRDRLIAQRRAALDERNSGFKVGDERAAAPELSSFNKHTGELSVPTNEELRDESRSGSASKDSSHATSQPEGGEVAASDESADRQLEPAAVLPTGREVDRGGVSTPEEPARNDAASAIREEQAKPTTAREVATPTGDHSRQTSAAVEMARAAKIPDAEGFVKRIQSVRAAEFDNERETVDPVTGRKFTGIGLMDQLESEGKDRLGEEFSRRRGYTEEQIAEHEALMREIGEAQKAGVSDDDLASIDGVAAGNLEAGPGKVEAGKVEAAVLDAATHPENPRPEPSDAQKEAGNYAKAHINLHGLDVSIENPAGSARRPEWPPLKNHYGYIRRTNGADGEHVDVFLGPHAEDPSKPVFVVDQVDPKTGRFDEHKVVMGATSARAARALYKANYHKGWKGLGDIHEMSLDDFKAWVKSNATKKPAGEHIAQEAARTAEPTVAAAVEAPARRGRSPGARRTTKAELAAKAEEIMARKAPRTKEQVWEDRRLARERIVAGDHIDQEDVKAFAGEKPLTRKEALETLRELKGDQTIPATDLADVPSKRVGQRVLYDPMDVARAARAVPEKGSFRAGLPDDLTDQQRAHADTVTSAVREVVKDWGENAPRVRVVASGEDLPASAKTNARYASAKGFYDGDGTAYIVAGNHATPADAMRTLAHEAIGHHGIERILNDHVAGSWDKVVADIDRLRDQGLGSAEMKSVFDNVAKRYPDADATTFAKEAIAVAAERGIRNGIVGRVIAAVRAFLRAIMPNMRVNEHDIRALLQHSEDFITAGTPLEQRQAQVAALAFSASEDAGLTPAQRRDPATAADAARAWREQGTASPYFRKFFGDSKVVDAAGKPRIVYHGTGEDFSVFESAKAGAATEHSTSPLGHFFTENRKLAERYAENAADGRPADERIVDGYVRMEKPYEMGIDEAHSIDTPAQARALRARLEREGYDGIHIAEAKSWVPFKSEQIKSVENRGTFDPVHKDINFSLPEASMDTLDDVLSKPDGTVFDRAKEWLKGKAENLRPAALGALQRRHLTELMDQHPALKGYGKMYDERAQKLDSERQQYIAGASDAAEHPTDMLKRGGATIAGDLRNAMFEKGPAGWLGRRKPVEKQLADVMHQATMQGLDPSTEYSRLMMETHVGEYVPWTPQAVKERMRLLKEQMLGRSGDDKTRFIEERKMLKSLPAREAAREKSWPGLVAAWNALPDEAKTLYKQQRDWYSQHRDATEQALIANVEAIGRDMNASGGKDIAARFMQQAVKRIRLQFEMNRQEGVYFPLNRDGDYWMSIRGKNDEEGFKMFESAEEAARAEKKLKAAGFTVEAAGRRDGDYRAKNAPSGTFVADVIGVLKKAGASEKVQDEVYQTFLKTLPEMSMRKHSIHRRKVPGFDSDIVRTYSKNAFHGAHQLARLRNAHEMQSVVEAAQLSLDNYRRGGAGALDIAKADALLGELKKRHDYIMSPKDSQLANVANSIGFMYYLGASPASAITNLTQNAQVTLPVLGAHHGWGKATRELGRAVKDALRTGGNIDRTLTIPEERAAYNALRSRGDIDKTQSHTLAGLAEGSALTSSPVWARAMQGMSYLFHKAEVVNREAAGMAAFRLARGRGDDFASSVQYASDIINGTHFDYSAGNRPRYMQGNAARAVLQFKNYSVGMTWMLYRNLYQAFKGESPEVRSVARKTLTGILGMTGLMAGTMGIPIFNALRFTGNAAHSLFGDDEPFDFDTEYRAWLSENLGEDAAKYVADGAVNRLGATLSTRVSLSNLWFRDSDRDLEGKDAYYAYLEAMAGPLGGIAKNMFVGTKMASDGNVWRGVETMLPKFAKDAMKATRFAHDGANTLRGDPILPDVSASDSFIQSLGFQPTKLFEQQRTNSALKNYEQETLDRRQTLMNAYAMAVRSGDDRDVAMAKIHTFNQQNPEIAIKAESIRQSLRARARYSATADNGIFLNKKIAARVRDQVQDASL